MSGLSSDQSSQFDCRALEHLSSGWKKAELNPKEVRTAHSQSNSYRKEDHQRLEVRDPIHVTSTSSQFPVRSKEDLCLDLLSLSVVNRRQPNPDQSNSRLPILLASPKKSYNPWSQQRKVPPNPTPSVPVNARPDRPVKVKFDGGYVTNELPASAVGLQAVRTSVDSTRSNLEDHVGISSVSPVLLTPDVQLIRPVADKISASISQASAPSFYEVRADTEMSASNYDGRPDDDDLYYSGDEEIYSTVGIEQTHNDVPVSRNDENHVNVRASDSEVREIWIRRAKGRLSSTTTKFVRSCILRGNTASSHAIVSYLPVKSNSVVPRKFDYMTVPDLTQFIKKDQNILEDSNRFDFTTAGLEDKEDELPTDPGESSTDSQKNKVPFPRSNLATEIRRIDMDQSESRISSQAATAPIDQSERGIYGTSDQ